MADQVGKPRECNILNSLLMVCMLACMNISASMANVLGEVNIRMTGTVVGVGCAVEPGDGNKPVNLGEWTTKQLKKLGDSTSPVAFSIHLTGCSASGVTLAFTGDNDKKDNSLLALNGASKESAKGVAVQIMDAQHTRIPLGDNSPRTGVDKNGNATLNFYANYVATEDGSVTAGVADADSVFTLTYD